MTTPPLAARFADCLSALDAGDVDTATRRLADLPDGALPPASAALRGAIVAALDRARAAARRTEAALGPAAAATADAGWPVSTAAATARVAVPGVSLVAACMNREDNLLRVLPSWLAQPVDEILIVDWSSDVPVAQRLDGVTDRRLRIVRVDGEPRWVLTHALNLAFRLARHAVVVKVDCDIRLGADFLARNRPAPGEFVRGFWKLAAESGRDDQRYVNGTFVAHRQDLLHIGGYDERIQTYGWDDSDLYGRLTHDAGLAGRLIDPSTLEHLPQDPQDRTRRQDVNRALLLGRFDATEVEGARNKFAAQLSGSWSAAEPAQGWRIEPEPGPGRARAVRDGRVAGWTPAVDEVAGLFAARQLGRWMDARMPAALKPLAVGTAMWALVRDAHRVGRSAELLQALCGERALHVVDCAAPSWAAVAGTTLKVLARLHPALRESVVIVGCDGDAAWADGTGAFVVPRELALSIARALDTATLPPADWEAAIADPARTGCTRLSLDDETVVQAALDRAAGFGDRLAGTFRPCRAPVAATAMATSVYDERNLLRLVEYLACIVRNLEVFERLLLCYERRDGTLAALLQRLCGRLAVAPGRVMLMPDDRRPTFGDLFALQSVLAAGTTLAVANADIAFDGSFADLVAGGLDGRIAVLSRWDVSADGRSAQLIRLENGVPNTFSADAWIVRTPFAPDFRLDYRIGTIHCDSFLNNQLASSTRYRAINPCLDVRVYHLHDERFNSSAEKSTRDAAEIERRWEEERQRNDGRNPIKGLAWSSLASADSLPPESRFQTWRPKAVVLDWSTGAVTPAHLLALDLFAQVLRHIDDATVIVRLRRDDLDRAPGRLVSAFVAHARVPGLLVESDDRPFDPAGAAMAGVVVRRLTLADLATWSEVCDTPTLEDRLFSIVAWPEVHGCNYLRVEVTGALEPAAQSRMLAAVAGGHAAITARLLGFLRAQAPWSAGWHDTVPWVTDLATLAAGGDDTHRPASGPRVAFVTSLFRGGTFLPGYLDNVADAATWADGEVIIVDANPDDADGRVIADFLARRPDVASRFTYLHLDHDPGLYACWRLGIERARAPLVTNANIDDRRSPWHTLTLVRHLEANPDLGGACGSIACTRTDGDAHWFALLDQQLWFHGEGSRTLGQADLHRTDDAGRVVSRNVMHCMPVWRRDLHARHGWFDEARYGTSADWAFWLRVTGAGESLAFVEHAFGRYFLNPDSHNRRNDRAGEAERRILADFLGVDQADIVKQ